MKKISSYVFIAGGMGITPFRSIISSYLARKKAVAITLLHFVSAKEELLFSDLFQEAKETIGIAYYPHVAVRFSETLLRKTMPVPADHSYYLSGSEKFIGAIREVLQDAGIDEEQIKTDIFSGY